MRVGTLQEAVNYENKVAKLLLEKRTEQMNVVAIEIENNQSTIKITTPLYYQYMVHLIFIINDTSLKFIRPELKQFFIGVVIDDMICFPSNSLVQTCFDLHCVFSFF